MKLLRLALIGAGNRCTALYKADLKKRSAVEIVAVCDTCSEKSEKLASLIEADGRGRPSVYDDYRRCLGEEKPDAVLISTAWEAHLKIAMYAMEAGIAAACEVGGAYSLESLWELVRCYERTGTPIMLLENCCYGRLELLALNMKRLGVLGRLVHCEEAIATIFGKKFRAEPKTGIIAFGNTSAATAKIIRRTRSDPSPNFWISTAATDF